MVESKVAKLNFFAIHPYIFEPRTIYIMNSKFFSINWQHLLIILTNRPTYSLSELRWFGSKAEEHTQKNHTKTH